MPAHDRVEIDGTVEDIFAHRFTIKSGNRKILADLTPKGVEQVELRVGAHVSLKGEMKPSELKVDELVMDGRSVRIDHKKKDEKGPKDKKPHEPPHHDHDPAPATKALEGQGYSILARLIAKPKHFEVLAERDGEIAELHVELDGRVRKEKPADRKDPKWKAA